jgi:trans-aconitate 2-methyltransferase
VIGLVGQAFQPDAADIKRLYCALSAARRETTMSKTVDPLILDLLEWIGLRPRPYAEVIETWRTSCPRLPVWEEANERGFIEQHHEPGRGTYVSVSALGAEHLRKNREWH